MKTVPLADARILAPIVLFLDRMGASSELYLDRLRIPGEMVESGGLIAKQQCHELLWEIAHQENYHQIGFAAYQDLQLEDLGPLATPMKAAKTVRDAIEVFVCLASSVYEGNQYWLKAHGDTSWLCFRDANNHSPGYVYSHQVTLMAYLRMVNLLAGTSWTPQTTDWHGIEVGSVTIGPDGSALAVPTRLLSCAVVDTGQTPMKTVSRSSRNDADWNDTFSSSLERLISSRFLFRKLPTLIETAAIIGLSPRTIQYRLQGEGLTYRRLLDRVCFDAACEMLINSNTSIRDISYELGYSGSNNFIRGFRRMTGMTPEQYRCQNTKQ